MTILPHSSIEMIRMPGLTHRTLANLNTGTYTMEVWWQVLDASATTAWCSYACEAVLVVRSGRGELRTGGRTHAFCARTTLIIESDTAYQVANTGDTPIELMLVLGMTPVTARDSDGALLPLPWDTRPLHPNVDLP